MRAVVHSPSGPGSDSEDSSCEDIPNLHRLTCATTVTKYTICEPEEERKRNALARLFFWYTKWALPGLGMFSEAYLMFSIGMIKPFQRAMFPGCFRPASTDCPQDVVDVQNYLQIGGIIVGMLLFGALGDVIGRKWGSRIVATIMLSGSLLLVFTPFIPDGLSYLITYIAAQTWYGLGVGGEYPMASSSAAERSQAAPALRRRRGEHVVLTFSGQGMGNLVNGCVILMCMLMFGQAGQLLDARGSRNVVLLQFAVGAAITLFMTVWRYTKLQESKVWQVEREDAHTLSQSLAKKGKLHMYEVTLRYWWPRLLASCLAWTANNFPFYGHKFFQSTFIALMYPKATEFQRMQWTVLNSAVALAGYFASAALVDRRVCGRRRLQSAGFLAMAVLFLACGLGLPALTGSTAGLSVLQVLYFLASFWTQLPNCTTWLVAAEVFPTGVRATFQGISAAAGKVGAILADVTFGYVSVRTAFYLSAAFSLLGFLVTFVFLPDTTGLHLDELDRMQKYALAGAFRHYHGEAVHWSHLSPWERIAFGWGRRHNPWMDTRHKTLQGSPLFQNGSPQGSPLATTSRLSQGSAAGPFYCPALQGSSPRGTLVGPGSAANGV